MIQTICLNIFKRMRNDWFAPTELVLTWWTRPSYMYIKIYWLSSVNIIVGVALANDYSIITKYEGYQKV